MSQEFSRLSFGLFVADLTILMFKVSDKSLKTTTQARDHLIDVWSVSYKFNRNGQFVENQLRFGKSLWSEAGRVIEDRITCLFVIAELLSILSHIVNNDSKDRLLEVLET
jgi:hypothetical protein